MWHHILHDSKSLKHHPRYSLHGAALHRFQDGTMPASRLMFFDSGPGIATFCARVGAETLDTEMPKRHATELKTYARALGLEPSEQQG